MAKCIVIQIKWLIWETKPVRQQYFGSNEGISMRYYTRAPSVRFFINDTLFADGTIIYVVVDYPRITSSMLQSDIDRIAKFSFNRTLRTSFTQR